MSKINKKWHPYKSKTLSTFTVFLVLSLWGILCWGGAGLKKVSTNRKNELVQIKEIFARYSKSPAVSMNVKRNVFINLLEKDTQGKGQLLLAKQKLKLTIEGPEGFFLLVDGADVHMVTRLSGFDGEEDVVQVTETKLTKIKKANGLLAVLFGDQTIWNHFNVTQSETQKDLQTTELKPQPQYPLAEAIKVRVVIDIKKRELNEITYWDELENKTHYKFSDINFNPSLKGDEFKFVRPKNAQVNKI